MKTTLIIATILLTASIALYVVFGRNKVVYEDLAGETKPIIA
jgi:hypothetical protein